MNTEQERAELLPCPFCGGEAFMEEHPPHKHSDWLVKMGMPEYSAGSFTIECVACECGMIHESRDGVVAAWNRRAALQSQDREDAAQAEWMVDDGRAPWAINSLKDRIKEMRASEKRCRNAFRKDYMRVVSVYFADALGEAAEALEKRLYAIDHARRIEGDGE